MIQKVLLVLAAAAVLSGLVAFSAGPKTTPAAVEFTGNVVGWHAMADGSVAIRLRGTVPNQEEMLTIWFVAPADQSATVRFEELVMDIVLEHARSGVPLTIVSERSSEARGRTIEDAVKLSAIRWEKS